MDHLSAITASTDDFLVNSPKGFDTFVLKVTGFNVDGQPVKVPGLNTDYGLYIEGTVAVSGNPSVYGPGTIALLLDPTDNDGSLSANFDPNTVTGGVSFSNPSNTADDITLASGQFVSGQFGPQTTTDPSLNGNPGLLLVNTFNPGFPLSQVFKGTPLDIQTQLFNTSTSRFQGTLPDGVTTYVTVNDGVGVVTLTPTDPASDPSVPLNQLFADLDHIGFLHGHHKG